MSAAPYTSNADAAAIARRLQQARNAVVVTHAKPDGDALGSAAGIGHLLRSLGAKVQLWLVGPFPSWTDRVLTGLEVVKLGAPPGSPVGAAGAVPKDEPDTIVIVDTGSWSQLDVLAEWLKPRADRTVLLDHHLHGNAEAAALRYIRTDAAACAEVVAEVAREAVRTGSATFPREVATPLYLGLATDTGWFKFSSVTPATLRLAADLLAGGVDAPALYEMVEQQDRPGRLGLLGRALSGHRLYTLPESAGGGQVCVMTLRQADFKEFGVEGEDVGSFSQHALGVESVRVCVVLYEQTAASNPEPVTKGSLRSKPGPAAVDVAAVCNTLGGGGHARAAGVKLRMPLEQARDAVLRALGVEA